MTLIHYKKLAVVRPLPYSDFWQYGVRAEATESRLRIGRHHSTLCARRSPRSELC